MEKKTALNTLTSVKASLGVQEQKVSQVEADLRIEREWRQRLQTTSEADKEAVAHMKFQLTHLQNISQVKRLKLGLCSP